MKKYKEVLEVNTSNYMENTNQDFNNGKGYSELVKDSRNPVSEGSIIVPMDLLRTLIEGCSELLRPDLEKLNINETLVGEAVRKVETIIRLSK